MEPVTPTIHKLAIRNLQYHPKRSRSYMKRERRVRLMREAARDAIRAQGEQSTRHLARDYRPGIGSGRTAHWLKQSFKMYAMVAELAHTELGLKGEDCRRVAKAYLSCVDCGHNLPERSLEELPALPISPVYWDNGYKEQFQRQQVAKRSPHIQAWLLWFRWHVSKAIGERNARSILRQVADNPSYRIGGYLAESIISWMGGEQGYEGCAGSEHIAWLKQHSEFWGRLLARAPVGDSGDGWEQTFPHEHERMERLRAKGWYSTFRMNDTIWSKGHPVLTAV